MTMAKIWSEVGIVSMEALIFHNPGANSRAGICKYPCCIKECKYLVMKNRLFAWTKPNKSYSGPVELFYEKWVTFEILVLGLH